MSNICKLTNEIKEFIISRKRTEPILSCRGLVALIEKNFSIKLSKSLINNVIKQNKLNSPVGRRKLRLFVPGVAQKEEFTPQLKEPFGIIKNGGCFFLKIADIKLSLSWHLASSLSAYFPQLPLPLLQSRIEFFIYSPLFEDKKDLCLVIGCEISADDLNKFSQTLAEIPLSELNNALIKSGAINHNLNEINELYKQCLSRLNSYAQENFFLSSYQLLDFSGMLERFYSLFAGVSKNKGVLEIKFFYPRGFLWENDIIWREDFAYAADKINQDKILTRENEQIWIDNSPQVLSAGSAFF